MPVRRRGRSQPTPHHGKGRACGTKVPYATEEAAQANIWKRVRTQGVAVNAYVAYECPHGDHWHVGHRSGGWKKR